MKKIKTLLSTIVTVAIMVFCINLINANYTNAQSIEVVVEDLGDDEYGTRIHNCGNGKYIERCQHNGKYCSVRGQPVCP